MSSVQEALTKWMDNAGMYPVLPKDTVLQIAKRIQALDPESQERKKLVSKLVRHNLRLVISFVRPYMDAKTGQWWGCEDTLDYLQVGVIGLHRAAEKFDPTRGYAFSTYATHWIRSSVGRYNILSSSPFKIPEEVCRCAYFYEKHGSLDSKAQVGLELKKDPEGMTKLVRAAQSPISLYSESESGSMLIDALQISQPAPVEFYDGKFSPVIEDSIALAGLTPEEDTILRCVFLSNETPKTISLRLGISTNRCSNAKKRALKKIKKIISPAKMGV